MNVLINQEYLSAIEKFLKDFDIKFEQIESNLTILNLKKEIFFANNKILELYKKIEKESLKKIEYIGEKIGDIEIEDEKNIFKPNFIFLDFIKNLTKQKANIIEDKLFLFLCGRDITIDSLNTKQDFKNKKILIIYQNKVIGIAKNKKSNYSNLGKEYYKNIYDKGILLRREFTKKRNLLKKNNKN